MLSMPDHTPLILDPDRLFPVEPRARDIARRLYAGIADLPIVSPHGHTDPSWFSTDAPFTDATSTFLWPDHYVTRMLYSQGISPARLGIRSTNPDLPAETDLREAWRQFAENYHLFRGTPSRIWYDHVFVTVFGIDVRLSGATADHYYDVIGEKLASDAFRPRALFERFRLEVLATTEGALDGLEHHATLQKDWHGRVITTFRPDDVIDADRDDFVVNVDRLAEITGEDTQGWNGYLAALEKRRAFFRAHGATATDHGHPTAATADLPRHEVEALFARVRSGKASTADAEMFRAQMLTEMARMSVADGMVMQIHPGAMRNHNPWLFANYGRDRGADLPVTTEYVHALKPLLDRFGNAPELSIILFTLDETVYARELAPLAGHYPALKLGPSWWFHDSPEGMLRFRRNVTETAGFYNTVGFNDDTRAFFSIPARHDVARRIDCHFLAELVTTGRLAEDEAFDLAPALAHDFAKAAYRL